MTNVSLLTREILRVLKGPSCFHGPFCPIDHRRGTWKRLTSSAAARTQGMTETQRGFPSCRSGGLQSAQRQMHYSTPLRMMMGGWDWGELRWAYGKITLFGGPRLSLCMQRRRRQSHLFSSTIWCPLLDPSRTLLFLEFCFVLILRTSHTLHLLKLS